MVATTFTNDMEQNFVCYDICRSMGVKAFLVRWKLQTTKATKIQ